MSIRESAYKWFKAALERGDLTTVRSTITQLPPLTLEDALSVALLICDREPENAERAAVRWLGRWALEGRGVTLDRLLEAAVAMSALSREPEGWEAVLRELVE